MSRAMAEKPRPLMTLREVCEYLRITRKTLYLYRLEGRFPEGRSLDGDGRTLRWKVDEVEAWFDQQEAF